MAGQAAVILLGQLAVWLVSFYLGYTLLIWPATGSIGTAFTSVGPALWIFGSPNTHGFFETAVLDTAAMAGLITVTLQIAYLPALYAAFNRRENEIALLNSRAGAPSDRGRGGHIPVTFRVLVRSTISSKTGLVTWRCAREGPCGF